MYISGIHLIGGRRTVWRGEGLPISTAARLLWGPSDIRCRAA